VASADIGTLQNAGAQIFGNELEFVGGQPEQEALGAELFRPIGTRNKGSYQRVSQGVSPVREEPYYPTLIRIIANPDAGCKPGAILFGVDTPLLQGWVSGRRIPYGFMTGPNTLYGHARGRS
jgi:hypothetical protein